MRTRAKIVFRVLGVLTVVVLLAVSLKLCLPISTPVFRTSEGSVEPNSIATAERWDINGFKESVIIRGRNLRNPVLIWVYGDSTSETAVLRHFNAALEDHFTVVDWDQRYCGQSYATGQPLPTDPTIEDYVSDLEALVEKVKSKLHKDKVVLVGHSWGSALGMLYAHRHPEHLYAYVGIGQVVNTLKNESLTYRFALSEASIRNDSDALATLKLIGPPPRTGSVFTPRFLIQQFGGSFHGDTGMKKLMLITALARETNWRDIAAFQNGADYIRKVIDGEFARLSLDENIAELKIPLFVAAGRYDHQSESALAFEYFKKIAAPQKEFMWFEQSAHSPHIEESLKFNRWMIDRVASTAPASN
jgi:pimeloyl-ACP methyl ester carboxylesterase